MLKSLNYKVLVTVFAVLAGILAVNEFILAEKSERTFDKNICSIDSSAVNRIILSPKAAKEDIILTMESGTWFASEGSKKVPADPASVTSLISPLKKIVAQRLVSSKESKWSSYEVTDSSGSRVQMYDGDELLTDLTFGKFSFDQQARTGTSYLRKTKEKNVFAVDGFLSMSYNQEFNNLRIKTLIKGTPSDWTSLQFNYPGDSSFTLLKSGDQWTLNGEATDSASTQKYLTSLSSTMSTNFIDDFPMDGKQATMSLTINGNNMTENIVVEVFDGGSPTLPYVLRSSQNPQSIFDGQKAGTHTKIFVGPGTFSASDQ